MKKLNSRGAALANIMLISAFVMVLASTIISIAMSNYRMKLININSKNNFYSCEALLDELRVGFRNDMTNYGKNTTSDYDTFKALYNYYKSEDRKLSGEFVEGGPRFYDLAKVVANIKNIEGVKISEGGWVAQNEEKTKFKATVTKSGKQINATVEMDPTEYNLILEQTNITFKNITITFEQGGYENSITSDIKIWYSGEAYVEGTPLLDYSVVSKGSVTLVHSENLDITFKGSLYMAQQNMSIDKETLKNRSSVSAWKNDPTSYALLINQGNGLGNKKYSVVRVEGNKAVINGNIVMGPDVVLDLRKCDRVYLNGSIYIPEVSNQKRHDYYPVLGKVLVSNTTEIYLTENASLGLTNILVCDSDKYMGQENSSNYNVYKLHFNEFNSDLSDAREAEEAENDKKHLTSLNLTGSNVKYISATASVFNDVYNIYFADHKIKQLPDNTYNDETDKSEWLYYDIGREAEKQLLSQKTDGGDGDYVISMGPLTTVNVGGGVASLIVNTNSSQSPMLQGSVNYKRTIISAHSFDLNGEVSHVFNHPDTYDLDRVLDCTLSIATGQGKKTEDMTGDWVQRNGVKIKIKDILGDALTTTEPDGSGQQAGNNTPQKHTNLAISYQDWQRN